MHKSNNNLSQITEQSEEHKQAESDDNVQNQNLVRSSSPKALIDVNQMDALSEIGTKSVVATSTKGSLLQLPISSSGHS